MYESGIRYLSDDQDWDVSWLVTNKDTSVKYNFRSFVSALLDENIPALAYVVLHTIGSLAGDNRVVT